MYKVRAIERRERERDYSFAQQIKILFKHQHDAQLSSEPVQIDAQDNEGGRTLKTKEDIIEQERSIDSCL